MQAGTYVFSEKRDLFAKIEHWPEFVDCGLAFGYCFFRRGEFQPCRQSLFARCRPSGAHQLKERPAAEHIKIGRVRMIGFEEPMPRLDRVPPISRQVGRGHVRRKRWLCAAKAAFRADALMNNEKGE